MEHATLSNKKKPPTFLSAVTPNLVLLLYTMPYWTGTISMVLVPIFLLTCALRTDIELTLPPLKSAIVLALIDFSPLYYFLTVY